MARAPEEPPLKGAVLRQEIDVEHDGCFSANRAAINQRIIGAFCLVDIALGIQLRDGHRLGLTG